MTSNYDKLSSVELRISIDEKHSQIVRALAEEQHDWVTVDCPFCHSAAVDEHFMLDGYRYNICSDCGSFYNSPRLPLSAIGEYYSRIENVIDFHAIPTENEVERTAILMRPRWEQMRDLLAARGVQFPVARAMEVGAGIGYFVRVLQEGNCADQYVLIEPEAACCAVLKKFDKSTVVQALLEDVSVGEFGNIDVIFINSVIEHPYDIDSFFSALSALLRPGGYICLVDMNAGGLDLRVLKQDAPNIIPNSILQIATKTGLSAAVQRHGLQLQETVAIGMMDVDILFEHAERASTENPLSGFAAWLKDPAARKDLQEVVRKHHLSGYSGYLLQKTK